TPKIPNTADTGDSPAAPTTQNMAPSPPPGYPYFPQMMPSPPAQQGRYAERASNARGMLSQTFVTCLLLIVAFASGWFGNAVVNRGNYVSPTSDEHLILQAWDVVNNNFVDTSRLNSRKMAYAAIDAIVTSLGDTGHSRFETSAQYNDEQN